MTMISLQVFLESDFSKIQASCSDIAIGGEVHIYSHMFIAECCRHQEAKDCWHLHHKGMCNCAWGLIKRNI